MLKSILTLLTSIICLNSYAFNVIGEDDRVAQKSSEYPYVTIGKFSAHIKGLKWAACTATLISENHIITNSHCVYQDGRKLEIEKMEFHVNVVDYFPKESVGIKRVYTPKENFKYRENRYLDWAILELKKPLGKKYGYIRPAAPNYAEDLTKGTHFLAGYSGDFESAHNAGIHKDCNLVEYNDFYLHHECDSGSGASGSSVIREENGSYSVVGLHNSGGPDKNTAISNRRFFDFYMFLVYGDHKEQVDFFLKEVEENLWKISVYDSYGSITLIENPNKALVKVIGKDKELLLESSEYWIKTPIMDGTHFYIETNEKFLIKKIIVPKKSYKEEVM